MRIHDTAEAKKQKLIPPTETENPDTPEGRVIERIKQVYDPEIPVNVYDLGLIYLVKVNPKTGYCAINMTLTSPACPEAQTLPEQVRLAAEEAEDVTEAVVNLVWEPKWDKSMIPDEAALALGLI
ncbi:MAG: iron-sulfur cluster assembly protein [Planctomycetota bacterium]